jgi:hypothetical protein
MLPRVHPRFRFPSITSGAQLARLDVPAGPLRRIGIGRTSLRPVLVGPRRYSLPSDSVSVPARCGDAGWLTVIAHDSAVDVRFASETEVGRLLGDRVAHSEGYFDRN